jgi:hypothetical protein
MKYSRRLMNAAIIAGSLALFITPAFAGGTSNNNSPQTGTVAGLTWSVSATVTAPKGTITGGWVTPVGTTQPPVSPGQNVTFTGTHVASVSGGSSGSTFVVQMDCSLLHAATSNPGDMTDLGSMYNWTGVDHQVYGSTTVTLDSHGAWSKTVNTSKTKFMSAIPTMPDNQPGYVADATTLLKVNNTYLPTPDDYEAFTVTFPTGVPHP